MLNRLHTHAASAAGNWMQALNFGILPTGRQENPHKCQRTLTQTQPSRETLEKNCFEESKPTLTQRRCHTNALQAQLTSTVYPCKGLVTKYFRGQSSPCPNQFLCTRQKFLKSFSSLTPHCHLFAGTGLELQTEVPAQRNRGRNHPAQPRLL